MSKSMKYKFGLLLRFCLLLFSRILGHGKKNVAFWNDLLFFLC